MAKAGDAQLKRDQAEAQREMWLGRPGPTIERAAAPFTDRLVAHGIPQGQAHQAATQEIAEYVDGRRPRPG